MSKAIIIDVIDPQLAAFFELPQSATAALLADRINELIQDDFPALVQLLYRLDISEARLKQCLQQNQQTDAGTLIARLVIERQVQKAQFRRQHSRPPDDIPDDLKW